MTATSAVGNDDILTVEQAKLVAAKAMFAASRELSRVTGFEDQPPWEDLPKHVQDRILKGVDGFILGIGAKESHERWRASRISEGWTHGDTKDNTLKTHPMLVPFEELPARDKARNRVNGDIVWDVIENLLSGDTITEHIHFLQEAAKKEA